MTFFLASLTLKVIGENPLEHNSWSTCPPRPLDIWQRERQGASGDPVSFVDLLLHLDWAEWGMNDIFPSPKKRKPKKTQGAVRAGQRMLSCQNVQIPQLEAKMCHKNLGMFG